MQPDAEHAANGLSPIFDKEKELNRLQEAQQIGQIGAQAIQVVATRQLMEANEKARRDPAYAKGNEYKALQDKCGIGSDFQKAAQAATAALQGLAGGNVQAAISGAAAPYLAGVVKDMTEGNKEANVMAHALLGAALAQLKGESAVAGAVGAGASPLVAEYLQKTLYPDASSLSEEQKQTISALTTMAGSLAGSLAGGDSAGALTGGQAAKNEVENNTLKPKEIDALGRKLVAQCGGKQGAAKSLCENDLIKIAVQESDRRNNFSPEYQKAFNTALSNAMSSVSSVCKADSQCVTEVANSLLLARLTCSTVECANDMAGGAIRNAAMRYGGVLDVVKLAVGDFGWLIGLKGSKAIASEGAANSAAAQGANSGIAANTSSLGKVLGEYSAVKPGPLSGNMAATFKGGQYSVVTLQKDTILYRAGTADQPLGQYFSAEPPISVIQTRIDKAVLPVWPGGATSSLDTSFAVKIPAGTQVYVGEVGAQAGFYVGGTQQIVVVKPWEITGVKVIKSSPLK